MDKHFVYGVILLVLLSSCLVKKQAYNIKRYKSLTGRTFVFGQVVDDHGAPLPATTIQGVNKGTKVQADKDGNYILQIADRSKEIKALWIGYITYKSKGLQLIAGDSICLNIKLRESNEVLID